MRHATHTQHISSKQAANDAQRSLASVCLLEQRFLFSEGCSYCGPLRLAIVFFVALPLLLWIWSLIKQKGKDDAVKRIMFGYWQAASLLMWTVYLQIGAQPISFATAAAVQVLPGFSTAATDLLGRLPAFMQPGLFVSSVSLPAWGCEHASGSIIHTKLHSSIAICTPEMLHVILTEGKAAFIDQGQSPDPTQQLIARMLHSGIQSS